MMIIQIMDFAENGDLNAEIKRLRLNFTKFEEDTIWSYFIQIVIAMADLHKRNILHRVQKSYSSSRVANNVGLEVWKHIPCQGFYHQDWGSRSRQTTESRNDSH